MSRTLKTLAKLFRGSSKVSKSPARGKRPTLGVERLEARDIPNATPLNVLLDIQQVAKDLQSRVNTQNSKAAGIIASALGTVAKSEVDWRFTDAVNQAKAVVGLVQLQSIVAPTASLLSQVVAIDLAHLLTDAQSVYWTFPTQGTYSNLTRNASSLGVAGALSHYNLYLGQQNQSSSLASYSNGGWFGSYDTIGSE